MTRRGSGGTLIGALDRVRPGISGRVGAWLGPPAPASYEGLVTALINELTTSRRR